MAMVAVASLPKLQQFTPTPKLTAEEEEDDDGPTGPKPVLALDAKRNVPYSHQNGRMDMI